MTSDEIRKKFLKFFKKRGHAIIPSAPLVPENDPSVLFNTAGMQPLVPYLLGQAHPQGKRLADVQKCVRTVDIDDIGDNTHATFFEMLGNWSLGDYFKEDAIKWSYEFLTSQDEGLGLDLKRLYVTVFEGDENAPRDEEAFETWKRYIHKDRIYFMGAKTNWWSPGENGPCGPDSEMFYDTTVDGLGDINADEFVAADKRQDIVEVWNDVFMEYEKKDGKIIGKLAQQNVDTGAGLERVTMVAQGKKNIFDTDLFIPIMKRIAEHAASDDAQAQRIIADHVRTAVFMIADGVIPSNTEQGYVLRRLTRRARFFFFDLEHSFDRASILDVRPSAELLRIHRAIFTLYHVYINHVGIFFPKASLDTRRARFFFLYLLNHHVALFPDCFVHVCLNFVERIALHLVRIRKVKSRALLGDVRSRLMNIITEILS